MGREAAVVAGDGHLLHFLAIPLNSTNKLQKGVSTVARILLQQKTGLSRFPGSSAVCTPVFPGSAPKLS